MRTHIIGASMTKRRAPLTIDAALTRIADKIPGGWSAMAELTGRRLSLVRSWADPDRREQIPLRDAVLLDKAYRDAGGGGAPIFAWFHSQLDAAGALAPSSADALIAITAEAIHEFSEAAGALLGAAHTGAGPTHFATARRELEEAIAVLRRALTMTAGGPNGAGAFADLLGHRGEVQ